MQWHHNNKPIDELPEGCEAFVYLITNTTNNKKYIGKKEASNAKERTQVLFRVTKLTKAIVDKEYEERDPMAVEKWYKVMAELRRVESWAQEVQLDREGHRVLVEQTLASLEEDEQHALSRWKERMQTSIQQIVLLLLLLIVLLLLLLLLLRSGSSRFCWARRTGRWKRCGAAVRPWHIACGGPQRAGKRDTLRTCHITPTYCRAADCSSSSFSCCGGGAAADACTTC